ncbi:Hypothetical protein D9617_21g097280 [Elsinoe fawcettii]|nr:Hypothetical protein D9617_21g097280 [Elsinoe fawcettii]
MGLLIIFIPQCGHNASRFTPCAANEECHIAYRDRKIICNHTTDVLRVAVRAVCVPCHKAGHASKTRVFLDSDSRALVVDDPNVTDNELIESFFTKDTIPARRFHAKCRMIPKIVRLMRSVHPVITASELTGQKSRQSRSRIREIWMSVLGSLRSPNDSQAEKVAASASTKDDILTKPMQACKKCIQSMMQFLPRSKQAKIHIKRGQGSLYLSVPAAKLAGEVYGEVKDEAIIRAMGPYGMSTGRYGKATDSGSSASTAQPGAGSPNRCVGRNRFGTFQRSSENTLMESTDDGWLKVVNHAESIYIPKVVNAGAGDELDMEGGADNEYDYVIL